MNPYPSDYASRRSPVFARRGMVAANQPLAVHAGLSILMQGGNAADAAIAIAAAMAVTQPNSTGLGGDCFALYYEADTGKVTALNASGPAPVRLSLKLLEERGIEASWKAQHPLTVTVPGACAGWCELHKRYGVLPMKNVLAPAITLAEEGFPVSPLTAHFWAEEVPKLLANSPGGRELTLDGRGPSSGEIMRNPSLANTLRTIAQGGRRAFYEGAIAKKIASTLEALGGVMTTDDLAVFKPSWEEPISTVYRNMRIFECPPNGQGLATLLALNTLTCLDSTILGECLSPTRLHHVIEALRLAFADVRHYVADPRNSPAPLDALLSQDYARQRAALIDPMRATLHQQHGLLLAGSDTVYFCAVDGQGNTCSFTNSNYQGFGTGIVPEGLGFSLQNRGYVFSLDPSHPNALAPGKRPYHTIMPGMVTRDKDQSLYAAFGIMGGFMQPQGQVQLLMNLLDDNMDPQAALDHPRFCIEGGNAAGRVSLEDTIPVTTMAELAAKGHAIRPVSGYNRSLFGRGQIIIRHSEDGVLCGGSDTRGDGCALGF